MPQLELDQDPARKRGEDAEEHDDDGPRHDPHDGQAGWEGEHAVADDLGDHEHRDELP